MAYGLVFFGEFYDHDGIDHRVEIRNVNKPDDLGAGRMALAEKPLMVDLPSGDRFDTILSKGITIKVSNTVAEGLLYYAPLFGVAETDNRVDYYANGLLIFQGYVIPALYTDKIGALPHIIEINANDRISSLKNELYTGPTDPPNFNNFLVSYILLIDEMLKLTGLNLDIVVQCQLFAENHTQGTDETFIDQTYLDKEIFLKSNGDINNAYTMLEEMLKPLMLRIYQDVAPDNKQLSWIIERIPEMNNNPLYYTRYRDAVKFDSFSWVAEVRSLVDEVKMLDGENSISYKSGYKTIELTSTLRRYANSLLLNTIFDAEEVLSGVSPIGSIALFKQWKRHDTVQIGEGIAASSRFRIFADNVTYAPANPPASTGELDGVYTTIGTTFLTPGDTLSVEVVAEPTYNILQNQLRGQNFLCILEIWVYDNLFLPGVSPQGYMIETVISGEGQGDWRLNTTPNGVPVDPLDPVSVADAFARVFKSHVFADDNTDYSVAENRQATFQFEIPLNDVLSSAFGDFNIAVKMVPFHVGDNLDNNDLDDAIPVLGFIPVNDFVLTVENIDVNNVYEGEAQTNFTERYSDKYLISELPTLNYSNNMLYSNYVRTKGWSLFGSTDPYINIIEEYFNKLFQTFQVPRFAIVGAVRGGIEPLRVLYDELEVTGKRYYQLGLKNNAHRAITELNLAELVTNEPVDIIKNYATFVEDGELSVVFPSGSEFGTALAAPWHYLNKWYYEVVITGDINPGVGIASPSTNTDDSGGPNGVPIGFNEWGVALDGSTGDWYQNNVPTSLGAGAQYGDGDTIGVLVDFSTNTIEWFKNGVSVGSGVFSQSSDNRWGPGMGKRDAIGTALSMVINTGATAFAYPGNIPSKWNHGWYSTIYDFDPNADDTV
jgi:hypothetical protein